MSQHCESRSPPTSSAPVRYTWRLETKAATLRCSDTRTIRYRTLATTPSVFRPKSGPFPLRAHCISTWNWNTQIQSAMAPGPISTSTSRRRRKYPGVNAERPVLRKAKLYSTRPRTQLAPPPLAGQARGPESGWTRLGLRLGQATLLSYVRRKDPSSSIPPLLNHSFVKPRFPLLFRLGPYSYTTKQEAPSAQKRPPQAHDIDSSRGTI